MGKLAIIRSIAPKKIFDKRRIQKYIDSSKIEMVSSWDFIKNLKPDRPVFMYHEFFMELDDEQSDMFLRESNNGGLINVYYDSDVENDTSLGKTVSLCFFECDENIQTPFWFVSTKTTEDDIDDKISKQVGIYDNRLGILDTLNDLHATRSGKTYGVCAVFDIEIFKELIKPKK